MADDEYLRYYFYDGYSLQDDDLYARVCKKGEVGYIRVDGWLENKLPPSIDPQTKKWKRPGCLLYYKIVYLMLHVFTGTLDKLLDFDNRENYLHRTRWRN